MERIIAKPLGESIFPNGIKSKHKTQKKPIKSMNLLSRECFFNQYPEKIVVTKGTDSFLTDGFFPSGVTTV